VSGANVAIVLTGVLWPLRRRATDRRVQALVAAPVLAGFVVLAGGGASVVRAAAMGAVALLALAAGRPRAALPALAAAVCVLLFLDPGPDCHGAGVECYELRLRSDEGRTGLIHGVHQLPQTRLIERLTCEDIGIR